MKIPCVCVDDIGRPLEVPVSRWVKKGVEYHVTHVYHQFQQKGVKGVELLEFDISDCVPYNCYRLDRFAFTAENIQKLIELMQDCTELDNIDISSIVEKLTTIEIKANS
jgi:hypothetical protein